MNNVKLILATIFALTINSETYCQNANQSDSLFSQPGVIIMIILLMISILIGAFILIIAAHGNRHPDLYYILYLFEETEAELTLHMKSEELMLFPQVRKMFINYKEGKESVAPPFGNFKNK